MAANDTENTLLNTSAPNRYETLVVKNPVSEGIPREVDGGEVVAWSRGHGLEEKTELEEFVRKVAGGWFEDTQAAAEELMDRMGWC